MPQNTNPLKSFFYSLITILIIGLVIFYATPFLAIVLAFLAGVVSTLLVLNFWKNFKNTLEKNFKTAKKHTQKEELKVDYIDVKAK